MKKIISREIFLKSFDCSVKFFEKNYNYISLAGCSFILSNPPCGSPPGVMMADTLSFNAKIGVVDF